MVSRRARRRLSSLRGLFFLALVGGAAAGIASACGLDAPGTGTVTPRDSGIETSVEASLPPIPDGSIPDAVPDTFVPPPKACPKNGDGGTVEGPALVLVDFDGGRFCIDETEVTNEQYDRFLVATNDGGDTSFLDGSAPDGCAPYTTFKPALDEVGGPDSPMQVLNFCNAFAYCRWAGKRLCKSNGAGAARNEWRIACTKAGTQSYPYGAAFDPSACNLADGGALPPKSFAKCVGGYPGIFDMVGNVSEWIDQCEAAGTCAAVGGAYYNTSPEAGICSHSEDTAIKSPTYQGIGVRCCRDPE